ncbi:MAG TPA: hypothetical protein VJJ23_03160 [Candidatus Nanoarchaeia archaeon]|nr:hypothetical protein [Candidatus Nanoarchaeia archaeon]
MSEWIVKEHPDFFEDLDKLEKKELEIFYKKKNKIKENPLRLKHLSGGENCYREEITTNIRLIYYLKGNVMWLLAIDKHDESYAKFRNRLHSLRTKYFNNDFK